MSTEPAELPDEPSDKRSDVPCDDLPDELSDSRLKAPILRLVFLLVSIAGLVASVMLTQLHIKAHTKPNATSYCSVHSKVDCLSVAESPWAVLFGVPVSVWAIVAYTVLILGALGVLGVHFVQRRRRRSGEVTRPGDKRPWVWHSMPGVMFLMSAVAVFFAIVMALISQFLVKSLCLVCAALYVVNTVLLVVSWLACRRHGGVVASVKRDLALYRRNLVNLGGAAAAVMVVAGALMAWYPNYWVLNEPVGPGKLPHGLTKGGHAWIGARNPVLTIHEFSDYQCGFCRNFNAKLRTMLNKPKYKDKVRLIHYHYPLDQACHPAVDRPMHPRSCELARAAVCAADQGKFWHMNDMMFRRQRRRGGPNLQGLVGKLEMDLGRFEKCLTSSRSKKKVVHDIAVGDRMAKECIGETVPGTPFYVFERQGEELRRGYAYEKVIARELKKIVYSKGPEGVPNGVTKEGYPWIGAKNPRLTIYELSDYECYFCKRKHAELRQLLKTKRYLRENVRLVHLQYPLGHQCNKTVKQPQHKRACVMARAALCAKEQGRFWEMNDTLYRMFRKKRPPNMAHVARAAGLDMVRFGRCLNTHFIKAKLLREIAFGETLGKRDGKGVPGAPAYFFQPVGQPFGRAFAPTEKSIRATLKKAGPRPATFKPRPLHPGLAPTMSPE